MHSDKTMLTEETPAKLERRLDGVPNTGYSVNEIKVEVNPVDPGYGRREASQRFEIAIQGEAPDRASIQRILRWAGSELMDRAG